MKTEYNKLETHSVLYNVIEELVFLKETKRLTTYVLSGLGSSFRNLRTSYSRFIKRERIQDFLITWGYMAFSSLLMFIAYKLVMIF
ncbi:MAG: hypothetical protein AAFY00_06730 [Bacteroidota bacterium]